MKTTARTLVGCIALATALCAVNISAISGQTDASADRHRQAADLLSRARQALAENDLKTAETLIAKAEGLDVQYSAFSWEDTPKRARRDLEKAQKAAGGAPALPSRMFAPLGMTKKAPPSVDPFAARRQSGDAPTTDGIGAPSTQTTTPPANDPVAPVRSAHPAEFAANDAPGGRAAPLSPPERDDVQMPPALRGMYAAPAAPAGPAIAAQPAAVAPTGQPAPATAATNENPLRQARRAMAVGDLRRASDLVAQARRLPVRYDMLDDTPDKVDDSLRRCQDVQAMDHNSNNYRRSYARLLLEQSEALLRCGDFDMADELADRASRQPLTYSPFETKPQDVINRIAAARQKAAQAGGGSPVVNTTTTATTRAKLNNNVAVPGLQNVGSNPAAAPVFTSDLAIPFRQGSYALTTASQTAPAPQAAAPKAGNPMADRARAVELVRQARSAIRAGQIEQAEQLARQAQQIRLPEGSFAPGEDQPGLVLLDIQRLGGRPGAAGVAYAGSTKVIPAGGVAASDRVVTPANYDPAQDRTRNVQAAATGGPSLPPASSLQYAEPLPAPPGMPAAPTTPTAPTGAGDEPSPGMRLYRQGETALKAHDREHAYEYFRQAMAYQNELDPATAKRLQDKLQLLAASTHRTAEPASPISETAAKQQALARQVSMELGRQEATARAMLERDPKGALATLEQARKKVEATDLDPASRDTLLRRADRNLAEMRKYVEQNRPSIELADKNTRIREELDRAHKVKRANQEQLAVLVDQYNKLMDDKCYDQAEVVAKRAAALAPNEPIVQQLLQQSKFVRNLARSKQTQDDKETGVLAVLNGLDEAATPYDDSNPIRFPNPKNWKELKKRRGSLVSKQQRERTKQELELLQKLKTPVMPDFKDKPLSQVIDYLAKATDVNIILDEQGLGQEGVNRDTPVTIHVNREIMLRSALNLILEQLNLAYVVKDEVLKVTSQQMRAGQVFTITYDVADLVMPIPNFRGANTLGLTGALHDAMSTAGVTGASGAFGSATPPLSVVATKDGRQNSSSAINPAILAQMGGGTTAGGRGLTGSVGAGPGGLSGGGGNADFDSIIDLITSTIQPTTWDRVGGPGSVAPFEGNLSLVISQTQEVHDEIADLLEQLRRLQDLQVTIEVRFITLNDNFFERIGVDFDFNIKDNIQNPTAAGFSPVINSNSNPSVPTRARWDSTSGVAVPGLQGVGGNPASSGIYTADLSIPFRQGSYALAVPQFGGFDAGAGASLGFAILSDIEAFFFINAAQGDRRSNILQAPKVTLFNGQTAQVADTSQTPFVVSVVPVVGDFAAAQQPIIVVLSEGTFMTVTAVVSSDRRFVRLTVVPYFSKIGDVKTFTFQGSTTTTTDTTQNGLIQNPSGDKFNNNRNASTNVTTGTTVQLPTFSYTTVNTTVSVPDGGTVLLGGIKRLSEGRNEFGVPILDKVPYLNRLFKNVAIGRDASSLMMTVTPRIVIQEEEEEKMGIQTSGP